MVKLGVETNENLKKDELYELLYRTCIQRGTDEGEGEIEPPQVDSDASVDIDANQILLDQDTMDPQPEYHRTMDPQQEYHITESNTGRQQNKGYVWNKGAFVSFVLNMVKQTRYIGMPRLIW